MIQAPIADQKLYVCVCVAGEFHFSALEGAGLQTSNSDHGKRTILINNTNSGAEGRNIDDDDKPQASISGLLGREFVAIEDQ